MDALSNTTSYVYDDRNRVTSKTLPDPDGTGGSLAAPVSTYTYDAVGNLTGEGQTMYGNTITHQYDAYGRRVQTDWGTISGGTKKHDEWKFDVLGRMTRYENSFYEYGSAGEYETYEYDSRGRMTKHTGHDPDGVGSQTGAFETFTYNAAGQPASHVDFLGNSTSYTYTTAGWLNSTTLPDPDGTGPLYAPIYTYGYDALGNNTSTTDPNK